MNLLISFVFTIPTFTLSIFLNHNIYKNSQIISDKVIFADISLNDFLKSKCDDMVFHYYDGEDHYITFTHLENDIFYTNTSIPYCVFSNDNYGFEVGLFSCDYSTEWMSGGADNCLSDKLYNYVCIDKYFDVDLAKIAGCGSYGAKIEKMESTYLTQRVWLENSDPFFNEKDDWGTRRTNAIGYMVDENWKIVTMSYFGVIKDLHYFYADIPCDIFTVVFLRMAQSNEHDYLIYQSKKIEKLLSGVCYRTEISLSSTFAVKPTIVHAASAKMLGEIVSSYIIYGELGTNGCFTTTVKNLYDTWFKYKKATNDEMSAQKILDYAGYKENGHSYEGLTKNTEYSVNVKWYAMCEQARINPDSGESIYNVWPDKYTYMIIIIFLAVAILCILIFYSLKHFKKNRIKHHF